MKRRLPKPLTLLLLFFLLSNYLSASPDCPIVTGRITGADGTTSDPAATGWYLDATNVASSGYFAVKSNRLHAQELGGVGIWYSRVFSTAGYSEFQVAVKISSEGDMNSSEYVQIYYKINGGAETLLDSRTGNFGTIDFISGVLSGNNVQLVVKIYNYNNGGSQTSKYYLEEYRVFKEKGPCSVSAINVTATAGNSGVLTCANPSLGLSATATGSGTTTWSWSGPNGYTSTLQNPTITTAGTYTVVATNSTGTGSASVTVTENKTAPIITATGGALNCGSCVSISATSNVSGATYSWSGPNSFTSTSQNPTVCAAGTYIVTVTNPANGCSAQQSVTVSASTVSTIWLEDFTGLANGTTSDAGATAWSTSVTGSGTWSVQSNEYKVSFSGSQGVGTWTSQAIDISTKSNVTFSVNLRSEVASGNDAFEASDYLRVYYKLNGGAETLVYEDFAGIGTTTNTTGSVTVNSASLNGNTLQIIIKASNSDPTERYFFDNINVTGSNAGTATITPTVTGTVTCTATAQLSATASSSVTAWSWTGPNGFTSSVQNPVVSAGGQYIVTATLASGCAVSATTTVAENRTTPNITATGGTLACLSSITLNVNSTVSNATYSWTGPNGFTSNAKNPSVSTAGAYTATVTNPANGCTASQEVTVTAGATSPTTFWTEDFAGLTNGTTTDAGATAWTASTSGSGTYSVQNNEFKTSFSSQSEGVWTSQEIDISGKSNVTISVDLRSETTSTSDHLESTDYIRVYYKLNGGAETLVYEDFAGIGNTTNTTGSITVTSAALSGSTLQVVIRTNNSDPTEKYFFDNINLTGTPNLNESATATAAGIITCANTSVSLLGSSPSAGVSYSWSGPNGYTSTAQNPVVTTGGVYTLTVTNPSTGCSAADTAFVSMNTTAPEITASANPLQLTCIDTSSILSGSASVPGANYSWSNAGGIIAGTASTSINTAGTYTLTVTNPNNGCAAVSQVAVSQNTETPAGVTATHSGSITCLTPSINITATVSSPGANYSWSGPNGYSASTLIASITRGGTYTFTAINSTSGCIATASTIVEENTVQPGEISINNSGTITCLTNSVTISGASSSTGVNYKWEGPNGYSAFSSSATVSHGGIYTLIATNPVNGCNSSKSTTVTENTAMPELTISNTSPLSCANPTVTLTANTNTPNASFFWLGPEDFVDVMSTTTVTIAGTYIVTVTDPANGCITTDFTEVTEDYSDCGARKVTTDATAKVTEQNTPVTAVTSLTHKAYPNPVITNGLIEFTSPLSANATVGIYNALGTCEKVLFKGNVTAGRLYRVALPATQLSAGAYYYIINTGSKTYTGKLVIVK
ncbi:T9SS type A sorting domain-containing protein [Niastella caeni]|uniref:T9SS type A sorting domain-containing protein n=1 Tax=Niastella caeni TaxID=2569763 RepID=A0A4S8HMG9_9BACT|nr:T9SS type A sorting domain-containing protein [Niastella caeni]THU34172.1 T9SS type A sorting domain-containing protein [Niastella caeni]